MIALRSVRRLALPALLSGLAVLAPFAAPARLDAQAAGIDAVCRNTAAIDIAALGLPAGDPLLGLYPDSARMRLAGLVSDEAWGAVSDSLRAWFDATGVAAIRPADAAILTAQLDALRRLLTRADTGLVSGADVLVAPGSTLDFNPQLVLGVGYRIFPGSDAEITIVPGDPAAVQRAFCWTALSASDVLGAYRRPAFEALRRRIKTALSLWRAYNEDGRSQYPWELWVNGLGGNALSLEPPRGQVILLHPWVGIEAMGLDSARFDDLGSVTRAAVVPFDIVGFIRYDETYTHYYGASLTLSLGAEGTRGGIAVHLSNGISFGPTWDRVGAPNGALFSVDFFKLLAGLPNVQREIERRLEAAAGAALSPPD